MSRKCIFGNGIDGGKSSFHFAVCEGMHTCWNAGNIIYRFVRFSDFAPKCKFLKEISITGSKGHIPMPCHT